MEHDGTLADLAVVVPGVAFRVGWYLEASHVAPLPR
jgi:hypothetical protein